MNNRYLVDRNDVPFLVIGDSPQALIENVSVNKEAEYIANRRHYRLNSLWINLLCNWPQICRQGGSTFDGVQPFLKKQDIGYTQPDLL